LIPWISKSHVWLYQRSNGRLGAKGGGMKQLLLTAVGRKSGVAHTVCLPYWLDDGGRRIVVASFSGAPKHPAWYHNVADRSANPTVTVQDGGDRFEALAEILDGEEYTEVWAALTSDRPYYDDYQAKTSRRIPLVRLVPAGP
jgi:deazaflavin-dependent oxidoreductase (nitroreductase family)